MSPSEKRQFRIIIKEGDKVRSIIDLDGIELEVNDGCNIDLTMQPPTRRANGKKLVKILGWVGDGSFEWIDTITDPFGTKLKTREK